MSEFMKLEQALSIVYDLAEENALAGEAAEEAPEEAKRQQIALNTVHDFVVNVISEGRE